MVTVSQVPRFHTRCVPADCDGRATVKETDHERYEPGFRDAVAQYLRAERRAVDEEIEVLTAYGPFRQVTAET